MTESVTELQDVQQQMAELARRAADVQQRMDGIRPAAASVDGAVTVTVTAAGTLAGVSFGAAARGMDLDALASLIMRTANEAHRKAAVQTQDALADLTGRDSAAVREMGRFIPPADDELPNRTATDVARDAGDPEDDSFAGRGRS